MLESPLLLQSAVSLTLSASLSVAFTLSRFSHSLLVCALHVFVFACRKFVILPVSGTKLALVFVHASLSVCVCVRVCVGDCGRGRKMGLLWNLFCSLFVSLFLCLSLSLAATARHLPLTSSAASGGVLLAFLLPVAVFVVVLVVVAACG